MVIFFFNYNTGILNYSLGAKQNPTSQHLSLSVCIWPNDRNRSCSCQFAVDNLGFLLLWFASWHSNVADIHFHFSFPGNCEYDRRFRSFVLGRSKWTWVWKQCTLRECGIIKRTVFSLVASQLMWLQRDLAGLQMQSPSTSLVILPADGWKH